VARQTHSVPVQPFVGHYFAAPSPVDRTLGPAYIGRHNVETPGHIVEIRCHRMYKRDTRDCQNLAQNLKNNCWIVGERKVLLHYTFAQKFDKKTIHVFTIKISKTKTVRLFIKMLILTKDLGCRNFAPTLPRNSTKNIQNKVLINC